MRLFRQPPFLIFFTATLFGLCSSLFGLILERTFSFNDLLVYLLLAGHLLILGWWILSKKDISGSLSMRPFLEGLFCVGIISFLFAYFYAKNANMDYVQRFMRAGGNLNLDIDSTRQRMVVLLRYGPLLLASGGSYVHMLLSERQRSWIDRYAVLLVMGGAFLGMMSLPSPFFREGAPFFAWITLVPLYISVREVSFRRGLFLAVLYGVCLTLFSHYWLATFSLVSLQAAVLVLFSYYLVAMPLIVFVTRHTKGMSIVALLWTLFSYFQHFGFASFPWATPSYSQFRVISLIQITSLTGIWGLNFLIYFVNAGLAEYLRSMLKGRVQREGRKWQYIVLPGLALIAVLVFGWIRLAGYSEKPETVRVALIQNNGDPRKSSYEHTFANLIALSNESLHANPDLVIWPETAFVPNIRRWSAENEESNRLTRLVQEFLSYQRGIRTWLLTGNDDYELLRDTEGNEIGRNNYNAAVLFDQEGNRVDTYRKIKLVPFTETFPYKNMFPWLYELLLEFDVHFWEAGSRWVVFQHPKFSFSVLICFEDSFPYNAARMVREGSEVLVNISNDYWAQDEIEAMQHFASSVFRAVENRRPLIRATTSGLTSYVDAYGRLRAAIPTYEQGKLVVNVALAEDGQTWYTRFGDWSAFAAFLIALGICGVNLFRKKFQRK